MKYMLSRCAIVTAFLYFLLPIAAFSKTDSTTIVTPKIQASLISPVTYMKKIANGLTSDLRKHQSDLDNNRLVSKIIYRRIVPHFDLATMARSVVGRRFWGKATPKQRRTFEHEFTDMIVNTYAAAVEHYNPKDIIKFHPIRSNYAKYRLISVSSVLIRHENGNKVQVKYKLIRRHHKWHIYDFSIESISMVSSYRAQFSDVLNGKGMSALIHRLKKHNEKVNRS